MCMHKGNVKRLYALVTLLFLMTCSSLLLPLFTAVCLLKKKTLSGPIPMDTAGFWRLDCVFVLFALEILVCTLKLWFVVMFNMQSPTIRLEQMKKRMVIL